MGPFEFVEISVGEVQAGWQNWYESEHTKFYTRSGRKLSVDELKNAISNNHKPGFPITLIVVDQSNGRAIGTAKLGPIDPAHGLADFAMFIGDKDYLGKGLSVALIEQGCKIAFERFGVRKLHSGILEKNIPSIKAYTRAGWLVEGIMHKQYFNDGVWQDWIIISKFNPKNADELTPNTHRADFNPYLSK